MRAVLYSLYYTDRPKLVAQPAEGAAPPPEPRTTLKIRIKLPNKSQLDDHAGVAPLAVLPLTAPASVVPRKRGRPRKQETLTVDAGLVPPPATAPARVNSGAGAKRFRPIKKLPGNQDEVHVGDATNEIHAAPGSVVNNKKPKKKKSYSKVVKQRPAASGFQPCPLDDADWDRIEAHYWRNKAAEEGVSKKAVVEKAVGKEAVGEQANELFQDARPGSGTSVASVRKSGRKV
ncbi:hypothetical protein PtB15_6B558 [Puccinia triticina]|nr:hypothetical protein PtB15_6B558 [Puccinia triticina]